MAPQFQTGKSALGDRLWLAELIHAMEEVSRAEPSRPACSETTLSALSSQLRRGQASADYSPANCSRGRVRRSIPRSRASSRQT